VELRGKSLALHFHRGASPKKQKTLEIVNCKLKSEGGEVFPPYPLGSIPSSKITKRLIVCRRWVQGDSAPFVVNKIDFTILLPPANSKPRLPTAAVLDS
jgi:hypothetical protein